ncbi:MULTISPECIES: hypothetical protein [Elizabethkingia]|uniref:hypothetical protein n=1 Tax=Elizabethkingia TaxID=308865 RepID=UPI0021A8307A|nr:MULTISPECIES: hypothetical protein [Elizabethkingia]MCT3689570.1 hypothetical protein [Elizabethkingia anophelis]MCT3706342.1 hypothetical protein [Elizabethkingia anophelis]MCT3713360.1 hypothetical protein [Elizabethkingia anophelis]MCT3716778.1 hypothetical protein [Elizabethkingia anophelis]MCT3730463.1 hypothetical protein [Elizabethkingia anophelis]
MANVDSYTDDQLKEALIKSNGQPTVAAKILDVTYISVYGRIRRNPELLDIQKSARQKTFQDLHNFQIGAVLGGTMKTPEFDEEGSIKKDEDGKVVYYDAVVGVNTRMEYASRLMTLFKSDEGIKDESVVEVKNALDITKLSDSALDELEKALKGDEK